MTHLRKIARHTLGVQTERDVGRSGDSEVTPPALTQTGTPPVITISLRDELKPDEAEPEDAKVGLDVGEPDENEPDEDEPDEVVESGSDLPGLTQGGFISTVILPVTVFKTPPLTTMSNTETAPSVTLSTPLPQSHDSTSSSSTIPTGALIGAVLGAAVLMGAASALVICYFRVLRRRRVARLAQQTTTGTGNVPPASSRLFSRRAVLEPYIFSSADTAVPESRPWQHRSPFTKANGRYATGYNIFTPLVSVERGNGRTARRAVDAGPVSTNAGEEDDRESTLPPEYMDVYDISRSPIVLSRR